MDSFSWDAGGIALELLRFDRRNMPGPTKLMEIYRQSNLENIPYFFPEEQDPARGLRRVEESFIDYLSRDFFQNPGNRYYVLSAGERWASAIRIFPVPEQPGVWYAEALETAPDLRRRGFGRKLMELLCLALAEEGPFTLTDSVSRTNAASLAFHEALGFEIWRDPAQCPLNGRTNPRSLGLGYRFGGWDAPERLPVEALSARYRVRRLKETDLPALFALCKGNPGYYEHCPPFVSMQSLREDMAALPPRRTLNDKYYLGLFDGERLAAVLDLIPGYPKSEIAFWGFFMLDAALQGQGRGTALVSELCGALKRMGLRAVRLGWVKTNLRAEHFWKKNGFRETGVCYETGGYTVVVAQRELT